MPCYRCPHSSRAKCSNKNNRFSPLVLVKKTRLEPQLQMLERVPRRLARNDIRKGVKTTKGNVLLKGRYVDFKVNRNI